MQNIITTRYWGRTGNVMFQIAGAIAYATRFNRPFAFTSFPGFPNLDKYSPALFGFTDDEFAKSLQDYEEGDFAKNVPFPADVNVRLIGFYQNYQLFEPFKDRVFDVLGIPKLREDALLKIGASFKEKGLFCDNAITVSLHIRKGDYQDLKCYFLNLDEYYYKGALLSIAGKLRQDAIIKVLCFYEKKSAESSKNLIDTLKQDADLAHCGVEFYNFAELAEEDITDVEEMAIMSHCNHHISANSTYSWWGAYMNPDPEKIVCYPDEHYNHQLYYLSSAGLNLPEWISVKAWSPKKYKCDCFLGHRL